MRRFVAGIALLMGVAAVVVASATGTVDHRVRVPRHDVRHGLLRQITATAAPGATCFVAGGGECGTNACDEFIDDDVAPPGHLVLGSRCPRVVEGEPRLVRPRHPRPRGLAGRALRRAAAALRSG